MVGSHGLVVAGGGEKKGKGGSLSPGIFGIVGMIVEIEGNGGSPLGIVGMVGNGILEGIGGNVAAGIVGITNPGTVGFGREGNGGSWVAGIVGIVGNVGTAGIVG
ncbi:hypothetical protein J5N97_001782 [Dioscorea zingiberensis]|uniref:Uncharacterized protein n=1 Tax=Dioscorea zingiberensis TaxID=325984 RepID=A0A9D5BT38_9LILI|nr:hypothetical protein J5N97_001782 [Dioscorea zingiberensis]